MKAVFAAWLLLAPLAARAESDFASACAELAADAQVVVVFEDRPVSYDRSLGVDALRRLASTATPPHHRVLGLTEAQPATQLELTPRILSQRSGQSCAVAALTLRISLTTLRVYLASELNDSCRRRVVEEHEQQHVAIWRDHLRAGARLLETRLRNTLGQVAYFDSAQRARDGVRRRAEELVAANIGQLAEGIAASHRQIDTASAYQYDDARLRACP